MLRQVCSSPRDLIIYMEVEFVIGAADNLVEWTILAVLVAEHVGRLG